MFESVLLSPAVPQDLDELLGLQLRYREEADLPSVFDAHHDAADPTSALAQIAKSALVQPDLLAVDRRRGEVRRRQFGVRLTLVGHEVEVGIAQRGELFGKRATSVECEQDLFIVAECFAHAFSKWHEPLGQVTVRWDGHTKHRSAILVVDVEL
jgi:hypothetical protein